MQQTTPFFRTLLGATAVASLLLVGCGGGGEEAAPAADAGGEAAAPADAGQQATGPTGSAAVSGTVTFTGERPPLQPISMDADPACAEMHAGEEVYPDMLVLGDDANTMGNIFVKVTNPPEGDYPAPSEPVVIDQQGCMYHPHVAAVMAGQPLQFKNSDGILHNVHLLPDANREQNIAMPGSMTETNVTLNQPESMFGVKCDVHPWMQAFVAVMDHPFFAVTDEDGQFTIENLPAGTYEIEAWHERLGTQTAQVTVADGETVTHDFEFATPN